MDPTTIFPIDSSINLCSKSLNVSPGVESDNDHVAMTQAGGANPWRPDCQEAEGEGWRTASGQRCSRKLREGASPWRPASMTATSYYSALAAGNEEDDDETDQASGDDTTTTDPVGGDFRGDFKGDRRSDFKGNFKGDFAGDFKGDLQGSRTDAWSAGSSCVRDSRKMHGVSSSSKGTRAQGGSGATGGAFKGDFKGDTKGDFKGSWKDAWGAGAWDVEDSGKMHGVNSWSEVQRGSSAQKLTETDAWSYTPVQGGSGAQGQGDSGATGGAAAEGR